MAKLYHTSVKRVFSAPFDFVCSELWRKAYETRDFFPTLTLLTIHQHTENYVLRSMSFGGPVIKEDIYRLPEQHTVAFRHSADSGMKGEVINRARLNEQGQVEVEFASDSLSQDGKPFPSPQMLTVGIEATRKVVEANYQLLKDK